MEKGHDGHISCAFRNEDGHFIKYIKRPEEGYRRPQGNQGIHIRRSPEKGTETGREEGTIDEHDDGSKDHFRQRDSQMVMVQESRHRKAQHIVAHGKVHENRKKYDGPDEAPFQFGCLMILQCFFLCFQSGNAFLRVPTHGFCPISRRFYGRNDIGRRGRPGNGHGVREE